MNNYNIEIRKFNGVDYDILYPVTKISNVINLQTELNNRATLNIYSVTLSSTGWSGDGSTSPYTQQISVSGIFSTSNILISVIPSSVYLTSAEQIRQFQYISYTTPLNNAIKFTCINTKPSIDLPIKIMCFG